MVLETIYICRHAFRMAWSVDPITVTYSSHIPTPTGLPADVALTSYGETQAQQLGTKIASLDPPVDQVFSSPYYRCLQTLKPGVLRLQSEKSYDKGVILESGFEEWYGETGDHREQPHPLEYAQLRQKFFPDLDLRWQEKRTVRPNRFGESIEGLHNRVAYALHRTIERADREGWKSIIICTHAAAIIAIGRVLTGRMPEEVGEEDFFCYTAGLSQYSRKQPHRTAGALETVGTWDESRQAEVPSVNWRNGNGVLGGWDVVLNSDCSFLANGQERGWHFSGDESFLKDPNSYIDKELAEKEKQSDEGLNLNRALCTVIALAEDDEKTEDERRRGDSKL